MDRLIIESIEGRIMLGITMFVAIMILTGWIAINEDARMAEFVEQHEGRSTERGAELFAANCSTCHGINGLGIGGRAPGLNNPQLFGYDFLAEVNDEVARNQRIYVDINGVSGLNIPPFNIPDTAGTLAVLESRLEALETQIAEASDDEVRDLIVESLHIEAQLSEDTEAVAARIAAIKAGEPIGDDTNPELSGSVSEEDGVIEATGDLAERLEALEDNIPTTLAEIEAALEGEEGLLAQREALIAELGGAINSGYFPRLDEVREEAITAEENGYTLWLTEYLATDANRLSQISFGGDLPGYITTTLIHGRPGSGDVWNGNIMVSWSQRAGGPLRDDQIGDLVSYITNWDKGDNWTLDDLSAVSQFAILHSPYTGDVPPVITAGTSPDASALPAGDAARGELLYTGDEPSGAGAVLGCAGCHLNDIGPATSGTWTRATTQRLAEEQFVDYTAEQYLAESIVAPNSYVVTTFTAGLMNQTYGNDLTEQDLSDLIAYLMTQDQ